MTQTTATIEKIAKKLGEHPIHIKLFSLRHNISPHTASEESFITAYTSQKKRISQALCEVSRRKKTARATI